MSVASCIDSAAPLVNKPVRPRFLNFVISHIGGFAAIQGMILAISAKNLILLFLKDDSGTLVRCCHNSQKKKKNESALKDFLEVVTLLNWPCEASPLYGQIRTKLQKMGTPIGAIDLLIASHALFINTVLVTNNTREFEVVAMDDSGKTIHNKWARVINSFKSGVFSANFLITSTNRCSVAMFSRISSVTSSTFSIAAFLALTSTVRRSHHANPNTATNKDVKMADSV